VKLVELHREREREESRRCDREPQVRPKQSAKHCASGKIDDCIQRAPHRAYP